MEVGDKDEVKHKTRWTGEMRRVSDNLNKTVTKRYTRNAITAAGRLRIWLQILYQYLEG